MRKALQRPRDGGGLHAEGRIQARQDVVELPRECGAFAGHENGDEHAVEEVQDKCEHESDPGLVLFIPEHPDGGKKKGRDGDDGRMQKDVDYAHKAP